jgi:plasmid stabilization system protein ParE
MATVRRLEFHPDALTEMEAALAWYGERSPGASARLRAALRRTTKAIVENPHRFPVETDRIRHARVFGFPYSLFFGERESVISVVAMAHGAREAGYWLKRLTH